MVNVKATQYFHDRGWMFFFKNFMPYNLPMVEVFTSSFDEYATIVGGYIIPLSPKIISRVSRILDEGPDVNS